MSMMEKPADIRPLNLRSITVEDDFWLPRMELVRTEMLPYQWAALNDAVEGAEPSWCMRNFRIAAEMNRRKRQDGDRYMEPKYEDRGFHALPEDPAHPDDSRFYGYVFQDTDFSKWVEAVAYSLTRRPDPALEALADDAIQLVCAAQQEDGYLDTYYIINGRDRSFTNLRDHHELYCFGHLAEGAVAYYEATGKDALLRAACRFADCIDRHFGSEEGKCHGYPGHEIAEMALIRLYQATGEPRYLRLSRYFLDARGQQPCRFLTEPHPEGSGMGLPYYQAHRPVREQSEAVGHAVRAVYLYSGMADAARLTGDAELEQACLRLWDSITREKMYITGGIGGTSVGEAFSFPYDLPNDTAYAETCASIGLVFFARRMLQLHPRGEYADVMERALYNGVLSGMSLDGKRFFYVNPLEVQPLACREDSRRSHVEPVRQKWFGCACCPPNLARLLSSLGAYACTEQEDTLFLHLYLGGTVRKEQNGRTAEITVESALPYAGDVRIRVRAAGTGLRLALRIPGWSDPYTLEQPERYQREEQDGYLYLSRDWEAEETVTLHFPMRPKLLRANTRVREDTGKAALVKGPMVYCLEEADNGAELQLCSVSREPDFAEQEGQIDGHPVRFLLAKGHRLVQDGADAPLYREYTPPVTREVTLRFVPYYAWANRGENEMTVWVRTE